MNTEQPEVSLNENVNSNLNDNLNNNNPTNSNNNNINNNVVNLNQPQSLSTERPRENNNLNDNNDNNDVDHNVNPIINNDDVVDLNQPQPEERGTTSPSERPEERNENLDEQEEENEEEKKVTSIVIDGTKYTALDGQNLKGITSVEQLNGLFEIARLNNSVIQKGILVNGKRENDFKITLNNRIDIYAKFNNNQPVENIKIVSKANYKPNTHNKLDGLFKNTCFYQPIKGKCKK